MILAASSSVAVAIDLFAARAVRALSLEGRAPRLVAVNESEGNRKDSSAPATGKEGKRPEASLSPPGAAADSKIWHILIVEDNPADIFLIRTALREAKIAAEIHIVKDGENAFHFIDQADADETVPCPVLVLLDLNLPKKTGAEVLQYLRQSRRCANAIVMIVTSSDSERDRSEMASKGANAYFRKPSSYDEYAKLGEVVRDMLPPQASRSDVSGT